MFTLSGFLLYKLIRFLALIFQIVLAVWVYRDAKKKEFYPIFWSLVVLLVPFFLGLLIYLFVTKNRNDLKCNKFSWTFDKSDPNVIYQEDVDSSKKK